MKYSGGAVVITQLALTDSVGRPYAEILQDWVLKPIGMTRSGFDQPLTSERDRNAARAHNGRGAAMDTKWHVYPELAAAGLWTTPTDLAKFAIEVQLALRGRSRRGALAGDGARDDHAGRRRPVRSRVRDPAEGRRLVLLARRIELGIPVRADRAHAQGYGVAIMTNSDSGGRLIEEIRSRVASAYNWDTLDKAVPR